MNRAAILLVLVMACEKTTASKEEWVEKVVPFMIDELCKPEQYFRSCFDLDDAGCRKLLREQLDKCVEAAHLPATLTRDDAKRYGTTIGGCAGGAADGQLTAGGKKHKDPACEDPNVWTAKFPKP